ncbi:MAG: hypothetical protein RL346_255 [Verrucomicrobiota bacterium]|jgi:hypothetical protein
MFIRGRTATTQDGKAPAEWFDLPGVSGKPLPIPPDRRRIRSDDVHIQSTHDSPGLTALRQESRSMEGMPSESLQRFQLADFDIPEPDRILMILQANMPCIGRPEALPILEF